MATEVKLPRLGQGMESGTIVRWLKNEGETVKKREPLYELDTDKVTQEVEAEADGVLLKIVVAEGEVDVGATIAVIGKEGEEVALEPVTAKAPEASDAGEAGEAPVGSAPPTPPTPANAAEAPSGSEPQSRAAAAGSVADVPSGSEPQSPAPTPSQVENGRLKASPLARRMARERGIDLTAVIGTGPDGRIVAEDVEKAASTRAPTAGPLAAPPAEVQVVQLTSIRKTIARRLTEAWQAPVFQLGVSADMTEVLALR
jgi:pyruvate/2-oxoglutarate dehydrogenase complex dihydrolipoamide acyltransferase (E2) component